MRSKRRRAVAASRHTTRSSQIRVCIYASTIAALLHRSSKIRTEHRPQAATTLTHGRLRRNLSHCTAQRYIAPQGVAITIKQATGFERMGAKHEQDFES